MTSLLRPLTFVGILALTALGLLPPWEACWHADGSACLEAEPASCCDEGPPASDDRPEPCSDCADTSSLDSLHQDRRPHVVHFLASLPVGIAAAAGADRDVESDRLRLPGQGPPDSPPPGLRNRPIRC